MKNKFNHTKCLECDNHVPPYLKFFCEDCWRKALNEKLQEDDKKKESVVKK